ncbi:MAG TPA: oligopeptide/dipeptide ABC transporter ATP-binding protein, partial [Acetobacteraceae bacterium]|nr:oligopeptide/dipeptide ABC transporter ATP-binding protein [Acetobacteraceae bacterium]
LDMLAARASRLRELRLRIRMVFQDPHASLNPRRSIGDSVAEAGDINGTFRSRADRAARIAETLRSVGLDASFAARYPHELSGGQRQRVGIARALILQPRFVVADEPVSALDVSVQAQIVNLLEQLRTRFGLAMLFVSHDLAVVGHISDRIAVMYLGRVVELGSAARVIGAPAHPYTEALLSAVPAIRSGAAKRIVLSGEMPSPVHPPSGCAFRTRCPYAIAACAEQHPSLHQRDAGHYTACLRADLTLRGA